MRAQVNNTQKKEKKSLIVEHKHHQVKRGCQGVEKKQKKPTFVIIERQTDTTYSF